MPLLAFAIFYLAPHHLETIINLRHIADKPVAKTPVDVAAFSAQAEIVLEVTSKSYYKRYSAYSWISESKGAQRKLAGSASVLADLHNDSPPCWAMNKVDGRGTIGIRLSRPAQVLNVTVFPPISQLRAAFPRDITIHGFSSRASTNPIPPYRGDRPFVAILSRLNLHPIWYGRGLMSPDRVHGGALAAEPFGQSDAQVDVVVIELDDSAELEYLCVRRVSIYGLV